MSYVSIGGVNNLQGLVAYVFYGNKAGAAERRKKDIRRSAASYCSMRIADFITRVNTIRAGKGLKFGAISLVQSFKNDLDGLDYKSRVDQFYVNCLGRELAQKLYPHSECLVVTHIDGKNHMLHNHIIVLNYDYESGHAITDKLIRKIRDTNDELMKEHNLHVIPKPSEQLVRTSYLTKQHIEEKGLNWARKNDFDMVLQEKIDRILALKPTVDEIFTLLKNAGITINIKDAKAQNGKTITGLTYYMTLPDDRERRRSSSKLGKKYTFSALVDACIEAEKKPLSLTLKQKTAYAEKIAKDPLLTLPSFTVKSSKTENKVTSKQPETAQQETTPSNDLTFIERAQVHQQREIFVLEKLIEVAKKLKAKLDKKKADLDRTLKAELKKADDKSLDATAPKWKLREAGKLSNEGYLQALDDAKAHKIEDKNIARNKNKADTKKANEEYLKAVGKSRLDLEKQAEKEITKPDADFDSDNARKRQKRLKKSLEKLLAVDNKKQKEQKKRKKRRKRKQVKKKKDLDNDGIEDEVEGIHGVVTDGGIIPTDAFDTDLGDTDLPSYVTSFDDSGVADISAKNTKQATSPKPKKQSTNPKPKKKVVNDDHTLQDMLLNQNPTASTQTTAPNYDNPQY